jgi:hypothetical protein
LANIDRRPSYLALCGSNTSDLFRRLAEELPAVGLFEGTDPLKEMDFDLLLESKARELRADRWSPDVWGDQWILTDFWFDMIGIEALADRGAPAEWSRRFFRYQRKVIQPTFVAATDVYKYQRIRCGVQAELDPERIGREVPLLWPGRSSPDETARNPEIDADEPDFMFTEILAACQASRAGSRSS